MLDAKRKRELGSRPYVLYHMYNDPWDLHINLIDTSTHTYRQCGTKHNIHGPTAYVHMYNTIYTLHPPSNSRQINSLEFGQKKQMLLVSLGLGEEISNLDLGGKVVEGDYLITNRAPSEVGIHTNMLGQLILGGISGNLEGPCTVTVKRSGGR